MTQGEIEERVREVLAEQLACDVDRVTMDARFDQDLNADSLDMVEAVLALEEELGVSIPEKEIEGVETVRQAVDLVTAKLAANA